MLITNKLDVSYLKMNNEQKALNLLGLTRRAGELISSEDIVLRAVKSRKVAFVFIAKDAGASTSKKFQDKCNFYKISYDLSFTKEQLNQATGQLRTVYGVTQNGFAKKFKELLTM